MRPVASWLSRAGAFVAGVLLLPLAALAQRPLGTDVSHWQASINWTTVKNAGVTFAWAKATEGDYYIDPTFATHAANAKAAGLYIGAYHFARPSVNPNLTGASSAETEAAFFWSVTSNYIKATGSNLVPMLDWEDIHATNGFNGFNGFTTSYMSAWLNQWCITISNYAKATGITLKPIVYTGVWYSQPSSAYPGLNTSVTGWPAWISAYNGQNPQTGGPSSSFPWSTWTVWQYADTNWSGGDSDVFNGNSNTLKTLLVGYVSPPVFDAALSSRTADLGGTLTFNASATSLATPVAFQWRFNGTNLLGATNASLTLTNIQATQAGNYLVVVTNAGGSVTSSVAKLTVNPLFTPVFADNFDTNSAANWTLNRSSSNTRVSFAYDHSGLGIASAPNSTGGTTKAVRFEANLSSGITAALNISPSGKNFGGNYRLHFDMWINANGPFPAGGTGSTEHLTAGVGTTGNQVQWNTGSADGVWFATDGEGQATDTSATLPDWRAYSGSTLQSTNSGVYAGGTDADVRGNGHPYYENVFPGGQTAPATQTANYAQQTGALAVGTVGFAWRDVVINKTGNVVEWFIDGLKIAAITNAPIAGSNIFIGYWDSFASVSDNTNLSFGLVDNLRVEVPAAAPAFTLQPIATTARLGTNVSFAAAATGLPAANYQWRFNGTNIFGATNATFALAFVALTNVGNYSVVASNLLGSVSSTNAALSLIAPGAAQFSAISTSNDVVQIRFSGDAYWIYTIETSTNLTGWSELTNLTSPSGLFFFETGAATGSPQQFFRARVGP